MGKRHPIASKNRTYLFIKNILKFRIIKKFSFAVRFNQLKPSWSAQWSTQLVKASLKKIGFVYLLLTPPAPEPTKPKKLKPPTKKAPVKSSLLKGWGLADLAQLLKLDALPKFKKPPVPKRIRLLPKKIRPSFRFKGLILVLTLVGGSYWLYAFIFKDLPRPTQLTHSEQIVTTRILSRDGEVLFRIYEDENRTLVKLSDLPQHLIDATIAIEDQNFYYHHGFDLRGIIRAAIANSKNQTIAQGGSTITQQLVKNRLLNKEKTIKRKLRELIVSIWVEAEFTKDEILEMYLNQVPYGGSAYGVEEAAQQYFGKGAAELTLAESALLAGLPQAPSVYSPFGANPELAKNRQAEVLSRMVEDEFIDQATADLAYNDLLEFQHNVIDIKAPHFVFYIKKLLAEQYGEEVVNQGGLEVVTTLDLVVQTAAQEVVTQEIDKLARLRVSNGAALVTKPQTGEILAMIGSKDYFDFEHDGQVNVTVRPRQPGSSIKPLTYALALESGKNPSSIIDDSPITYHSAGSPPYSPKNYDGKFHGKVTLREALASSYNVPAVKTLAEIGVSNMLDKAQELGIDTWQDRSRFGLSLTLGGGEIKMTDMAELYGTFANYGQTVELNPILEVKNYKGETLYRNTCVLDNQGCPQQQTLDRVVAYQISDILSDNQARTSAFGPRSVLHIPNQQVAVKTGTTNNLRDNWTIGYTTEHLVAVWVGNNDNTPMSYVASGITGASPIWNKITRLLLSQAEPHLFPTPEGLVKVKICASTGTLPCEGCPQVSEELFLIGSEPTNYCAPAWFQENQTDLEENRDQILQGSHTTQ